MIDSNSECQARARRIMTTQREYPIFTTGFPEPGGSNSDQSRARFQDESGQGVWKEIHTDTGGQYSSGSISSNILTPSPVSATSLEQAPGFPNSSYMASPAVVMSPSRARGGGRIAVNTTGSNYYAPGMMRGSPTVPHSPQNVNILSSQLRPLEKSPKRTQLHIANPRITEIGGLTPMVNQLTLSPDQAPRPVYDHDVELHPTMLPPAAAAQSPHQVTLSSPEKRLMSSSMNLKMMKPGADQTPRSSVSKDRSPSRTWKSSFRAVSPAMATMTLQSNAARGMTREMNSSFQENTGRATAAGAACVNVHSSSVPSWRGCGDGVAQAMVAPTPDREICPGDLSGELERPDVPPHRVRGKKLASTQKSGSYNIFNFLGRGKKKSTWSTTMTTKLPMPTESFLESDDLGSVKVDPDSIKVLDHTIKTLRYKLEQASVKCATAEDEACALQSALEASELKCRQLTQRRHELELQLSARSSGLRDVELEERTRNASSIVGRGEPHPAHISAARFPLQECQELTPEQFLKVFEDAIASLRKLASALCHHIRENGESATQVITALLEQHKVGRAVTRMPRNVIILYFESFLNQVMFESFENVSFEPNGASSVFCPDTVKQQSLQAFQSLKSQEWSAIEKTLGKPGAVVVNASVHRFFAVRMELILSQLGKLAEKEISLSLMATFFNAVKAVWLVHHMAFAFHQPVSIFRVSPASEFDARFMEQVMEFDEEQQQQGGARAKISIMVNPGFIVNRQIIKCQVYCDTKYE